METAEACSRTAERKTSGVNRFMARLDAFERGGLFVAFAYAKPVVVRVRLFAIHG
jgi:hypothetical protein